MSNFIHDLARRETVRIFAATTMSSNLKHHKEQQLLVDRCILSVSVSRKWRVTSRITSQDIWRPECALIARNLIAIRMWRRDDWSRAKNGRPLGYLDVYPVENGENLTSGHVRKFLTVPFDLISEAYALFSGSCCEWQIFAVSCHPFPTFPPLSLSFGSVTQIARANMRFLSRFHAFYPKQDSRMAKRSVM